MKIFIYKLTSPSNKSYIGISNNPQKRFGEHCYTESCIGRAIRKYGRKNVTLEILDEVEGYNKGNELEQQYIKEFNTLVPSGYNLDSGGRSGNTRTKESIQKGIKTRRNNGKPWQSEKAIKKRIKTRRDNGQLWHSQETKINMSKAKIGTNRSEETKKKIGKTSRIFREEQIKLALIAFNDGWDYKELAFHFNLHISTVRKYLNRKETAVEKKSLGSL